MEKQSCDEWRERYGYVEGEETLNPPTNTYKPWIHGKAGKITDNILVSATPTVVDIPSTPILVYDSHRTSKNPSYKTGTLTLVFINVETGQEVVAFFNVDVTHQKKPNRGKNKTLGRGCEFLPAKGSNFRKFWLIVTGIELSRWAAVHKKLKSKFKGLKFTGDLTVGYDKDGKPFNKVTNVRLIEPSGNKIGTKVEQDWNKKGTETWYNESVIPF